MYVSHHIPLNYIAMCAQGGLFNVINKNMIRAENTHTHALIHTKLVEGGHPYSLERLQHEQI